MDSVRPALPHLNATLNLIAGVLLVLGFRAVKAGHLEKHKKLMVSAFICSAFFLLSYLIHKFNSGNKTFSEEGAIWWIYIIVLVSHFLLAMLVPPLAITTIILGFLNKVEKHRKFARVTFPIWMYVSVTGVIVYLMLYQIWPGE